MKTIVLVPVLALVTAAGASGQQREAVPEQRGYVSAIGGAVAGPVTAPAFAVEVGDNFHRNAQAYVTLSYFENLMKQTLSDDLNTLGTDLSTLTGTPWDLQGRDRGVSLIGGAKYLLGSGSVRPYVGGGAGIISLRRTVTDTRLGDVRAAVFNDYFVGEADLSLAPASVTRPLMEAALGVGIVSGNTYFDIGYRYRRAFRLADNLDFSQLSAGIGYKF
jgi:hypothetical protein